MLVVDEAEKPKETAVQNGSYFESGKIKQNANEFAEAIIDFDMAIVHNPRHIEAFLHKGQCRNALGLNEDALS